MIDRDALLGAIGKATRESLPGAGVLVIGVGHGDLHPDGSAGSVLSLWGGDTLVVEDLASSLDRLQVRRIGEHPEG